MKWINLKAIFFVFSLLLLLALCAAAVCGLELTEAEAIEILDTLDMMEEQVQILRQQELLITQENTTLKESLNELTTQAQELNNQLLESENQLIALKTELSESGKSWKRKRRNSFFWGAGTGAVIILIIFLL